MTRLWLNFTLAASLCYSFVSVSVSVSALATEFKWDADLNCISGRASSLETSHVDLNMLKNEHFDGDMNNANASMQSKVRREFAEYPQFLSRRKLFFGILTAKQSVNDHGQTITTVCDSLFGINLLAFGEASFSGEGDVNGNGNGDGDGEGRDPRTRNGKDSDGFSTTVFARIPVVGGILACKSKGQGQGQGQGQVRGNCDERNERNDLGELWFQLSHSLPNVSEATKSKHMVRLESRVVDYRPAISGLPPVNALRCAMYLNTQKYVHAYVMWRFHNHCYGNLLL